MSDLSNQPARPSSPNTPPPPGWGLLAFVTFLVAVHLGADPSTAVDVLTAFLLAIQPAPRDDDR